MSTIDSLLTNNFAFFEVTLTPRLLHFIVVPVETRIGDAVEHAFIRSGLLPTFVDILVRLRRGFGIIVRLLFLARLEFGPSHHWLLLGRWWHYLY